MRLILLFYNICAASSTFCAQERKFLRDVSFIVEKFLDYL